MENGIFKKELPRPLVMPAPFLLGWAHFEILRAGCPYCGGRAFEFIRGGMGPVDFPTEMSRTSNKIPPIIIHWEDICHHCKKCHRNFTYRFLSPQTPQQTYEEIARAFIQDLVAFFAGEMAENEIIPNYAKFRGWLEALFKSATREEKAKNIPLTRWILEEIQHLAEDLPQKLIKSASQKPDLTLFKQFKLIIFAINDVLPHISAQSQGGEQ